MIPSNLTASTIFTSGKLHLIVVAGVWLGGWRYRVLALAKRYDWLFPIGNARDARRSESDACLPDIISLIEDINMISPSIIMTVLVRTIVFL